MRWIVSSSAIMIRVGIMSPQKTFFHPPLMIKPLSTYKEYIRKTTIRTPHSMMQGGSFAGLFVGFFLFWIEWDGVICIVTYKMDARKRSTVYQTAGNSALIAISSY